MPPPLVFEHISRAVVYQAETLRSGWHIGKTQTRKWEAGHADTRTDGADAVVDTTRVVL